MESSAPVQPGGSLHVPRDREGSAEPPCWLEDMGGPSNWGVYLSIEYTFGARDFKAAQRLWTGVPVLKSGLRSGAVFLFSPKHHKESPAFQHILQIRRSCRSAPFPTLSDMTKHGTERRTGGKGGLHLVGVSRPKNIRTSSERGLSFIMLSHMLNSLTHCSKLLSLVVLRTICQAQIKNKRKNMGFFRT